MPSRQRKRRSFDMSILGREKQGLMCCSAKGKVATDGTGKAEDFDAFRSPAVRCLA